MTCYSNRGYIFAYKEPSLNPFIVAPRKLTEKYKIPPDVYPFPPYVMVEFREIDDPSYFEDVFWLGLVDKRNRCDLDGEFKTKNEITQRIDTRATDAVREWVADYWKKLKENNVW